MTDGTIPTLADRLNADAVPTLMGLARAFRRAGRAADPLMFAFEFAGCGFCGLAIAARWRPVLRSVCSVGPPCADLWLAGKSGFRLNPECLFAR